MVYTNLTFASTIEAATYTTNIEWSENFSLTEISLEFL